MGWVLYILASIFRANFSIRNIYVQIENLIIKY